MSRNAKIPETMPQFEGTAVNLSNTASALTASRPFLRTVDATTNIVTDGATNHVAFSFKVVNAAGTAIRGVAGVFVDTTGGGGSTLATASTWAASVGVLVSSISNGTTPVAGGAFFMASSGGIITGTCLLSGTATGVTVVIQYGNEQIVITSPAIS